MIVRRQQVFGGQGVAAGFVNCLAHDVTDPFIDIIVKNRQSTLFVRCRPGDDDVTFFHFFVQFTGVVFRLFSRQAAVRVVDIFLLKLELLRLSGINDVREFVVRNHMQAVDAVNAGSFSERQTQTAADRLFDQNFGIGGAKRHNSIKVVDVPAFAQHIDMDNDFGRFIGVFDCQQPLQNFVFQFAVLFGVDDDNLVFIAAAFKIVAFYFCLDAFRMVDVLGNNHHKRFDQFGLLVVGINLQFRLDAFVYFDAVFDFQIFQRFGIAASVQVAVKIQAADDCRFFDVTVANGVCQIVFIGNVAEGFALGTDGFCGGRQFNPQNRVQFIDGGHAGVGPVAVRFIHNQNQIL